MKKPRIVRKTKKFITGLINKYNACIPYSKEELGYFYFKAQKIILNGVIEHTYYACYNNVGQCKFHTYYSYEEMQIDFANNVFGGKDNGDLQRTPETK